MNDKQQTKIIKWMVIFKHVFVSKCMRGNIALSQKPHLRKINPKFTWQCLSLAHFLKQFVKHSKCLDHLPTNAGDNCRPTYSFQNKKR